MKYLILILIFVIPSFAADLINIPLTNYEAFNFFFSVYANISFYLVPIFGAMALLRN